MKHIILAIALFVALSLTATTTLALAESSVNNKSADSTVQITIIHTNDIYEITPVGGGTLGGLSRLATLKKQLLAENPNTLLFFAGDMYGPSGLSTAVVDGRRLDGIQAVEVMNHVGVDYMTFGDHEFDELESEENFFRNLAATKFPMISSNVFYTDGMPFTAGDTTVAVNDILTMTNGNGDEVSIGLFAITEEIGSAEVPYSYTNHISATEQQVAALDGQVDILIALTHFGINTDIETANQFSEIDLILGGDDHENMVVQTDNAPIYKSDSNARNVQVIDLFYDTTTGEFTIEDRLQAITNEIADDPATLEISNSWVITAFNAFRAEGIEPEEIIAETMIDLDGFATSIRNHPTAFTNLMMEGIQNAAPNADIAFHISGLIRMDDLIPAGSNVTVYDTIRNYPTNSTIVSVQLPGSTVEGLLNFRPTTAGAGNFFHISENITSDGNAWLINGQPLMTDTNYIVGTSQYYYDTFLGQPFIGGVLVGQSNMDLRGIMIQQLRQAFGLQLQKTVGTEADSCASSDTLSVATDMANVTYCYTVTNTTAITLTTHTLTDSVEGTPVYSMTANHSLAPGATYSVTWSTIISTDTTNSATWVSSDGTMTNTLSSTDMATVTLGVEPTALEMTSLKSNSGNTLFGIIVIAMTLLVGSGYLLTRRDD